ncbi:hypothetical protein TBR22_A48850 [Luteitalea sp. TBR-22]|uniref:hypothetical protein n=1 Tax=Luteitalea sp. TBR-22 TaxID=2802971 RepID=UPI001AF4585A|nr:hypothetical protein [Luteitalea sp. TBR-22]BCS35651.1 hypothetical protein TBR22_A48850 [Luteitalea sp. TBR-22]
MESRRPAATLLASLAWCAACIAAIVVVMGPLSVPAIRLSISDPTRPSAVAALLLIAAIALRRSLAGLLDDLSRSVVPYAATLVLAGALMAALLGVRGATNVGGADSAGYLLQARRWLHGQVRQPLPLVVPGLPGAWPQSTLGTRPDPHGTGTVPTYPPGLPWLEALALAAGGEALAVRGLPLAAALAALLGLWALARPRVGPAGAAFAVVTLASLPTFLYQALQPMSDVPALAGWIVALALAGRRSGAALAGASIATLVTILVRPNLAPLALPVAWQAWTSSSPRRPAARALAIGASTIAAVVIVALVQWRLYGSPTQSGYGSASELFALSNVASNLRLYPGWILESCGAATVLALVAGLAWWSVQAVRQPQARPPIAMALLTLVLYLVYAPFDSWSYLRFILVPLAILPVGAGALLATREDCRAPRWRFPVFAVAVLVVVLPNLVQARRLTVFSVRQREFRYQAAGEFVRSQLPATAIVVATQHSASAAYYGQRPVVRADLLTPDAFAALVNWARAARRPIAFVLDEAEPAMLRQRFGEQGPAALDWPPRAEVGRPVATRVWVDEDREPYRAGGRVRTTRITGP